MRATIFFIINISSVFNILMNYSSKFKADVYETLVRILNQKLVTL